MRWLVLFAVVAFAGCGDEATSSSTEQPSSSPTSSNDAAEGTAIDSPVMRYPQRSSDAEELAAEVRGVLQLEGSCLYVFFDAAGERYPVLWPAGTHWDEANKSVVSPAGEPMPIGSEVYGGGGYFYGPDVERIAGPEAASLASRCVDNQYGEIAMVNNVDTAIGPAEN